MIYPNEIKQGDKLVYNPPELAKMPRHLIGDEGIEDYMEKGTEFKVICVTSGFWSHEEICPNKGPIRFFQGLITVEFLNKDKKQGFVFQGEEAFSYLEKVV